MISRLFWPTVILQGFPRGAPRFAEIDGQSIDVIEALVEGDDGQAFVESVHPDAYAGRRKPESLESAGDCD